MWKGTTVSMCRSGCVTSCHLAFNSKIKEELAAYMPKGILHNGVSSGVRPHHTRHRYHTTNSTYPLPL
jgi:hypothetical protein